MRSSRSRSAWSIASSIRCRNCSGCSAIRSNKRVGAVMHFQLKSISADCIPEALAKVERYRLLNEPSLAESICLDILAIVPDNQQALISLLLARTDQFDLSMNARNTLDVLDKITGEYERAYYHGIIWERLGLARMRQGMPGNS